MHRIPFLPLPRQPRRPRALALAWQLLLPMTLGHFVVGQGFGLWLSWRGVRAARIFTLSFSVLTIGAVSSILDPGGIADHEGWIWQGGSVFECWSWLSGWPIR